ncbi:hypothetical protein RND81_07G168300 [Saponaria officinalis]|uniref:DUF1365 domain-containing protein n=1 Tax=Saponaria officinalis TaxID=3572 RepID=A0AAW1JS72_SAPOF
MELLYLLGSITSIFFTSFTLSLLLPFQLLLRRIFPSLAAADEAVTLYEGVVWHERRRPVHHSFRYNVRYALIDLDRSSQMISSSNYISADSARKVAGTNGPVYLLTIPPSVGYEQNPLSVYYCYDFEDSSSRLKKCIAHVTNTPWGERVSFVFNPCSDLVAKALHVSPFMDMLGNWRINATMPGDDLSIVISVQHPDFGEHFCAILKAKKLAASPDHRLYFWLMPHKVAVWIYWHALKLWWKRVPFVQHPRYANPAYRAEASSRDQMLGCCFMQNFETTAVCSTDSSNLTRHHFSWTDAKWPWS